MGGRQRQRRQRAFFPAQREIAGDTILVVCNFTPVPRDKYAVGVPSDGYWRELLNSDAGEYGGSGIGNMGGVEAEEIEAHGRPFSGSSASARRPVS